METTKDISVERIPNRYSLVVLAAKRAKQIKEGAPPLIVTDSANCLTIALDEIVAGKINYIEAPEPVVIEVAQPSTAPANTPATPPSAMQILTESLSEAEREASSELEPAEAESAEDTVTILKVEENESDDAVTEHDLVEAATSPVEEE